MPLHDIPVILPHRLGNDDNGPLLSHHVESVATNGAAALAAARACAQVSVALRHPGKKVTFYKERARTGPARYAVTGAYAYIITRNNRVPHLSFPSRIDGMSGVEFEQSLAGIKEEWIYGSLMDCAQLKQIESQGIASLVNHSRRLNLHLFRVPPHIQKILDLVGVGKHLFIHPDLRGALNGISFQCRQ